MQSFARAGAGRQSRQLQGHDLRLEVLRSAALFPTELLACPATSPGRTEAKSRERAREKGRQSQRKRREGEVKRWGAAGCDRTGCAVDGRFRCGTA